MSEFIHIAHATEAQYDEVMDVLNRSFEFKGIGKFDDLLPKLYKKKYDPMKNQVILDVDGEIRAGVGVFYNDVHVGDETLKFAGIGNVAVLPEQRSKGYMQADMLAVLDEMKQNMTDISFLSGHRQRYAHFFYEPGGICYVFDFMQRNFRHMYGKYEKSADCKGYPVTADNTEVLRKIKAYNDSKICRFERDLDSLYDTLISWYNKPYYVEKNGEYIGYFVYNPERTEVNEVGFTDEKYIEDIVHVAIDEAGGENLKFEVPEYEKALCNFLYIHGECVSVDISEKFNILNYTNVLRAYLKLKSTYTTLADGHIKIQINTIKLPETVEITVKDNSVTVEESFDTPDIILENMDAMRIFTSPYCNDRDKLPANVKSWFPLPIFVSSTDSV